MAEKTKSVSKVEAFNTDQIELIKKTIAVGATDDELQLFLYTAKRTGLDPLARQIYFIKRRTWNKVKNGYDEKANIQSSIDGFRVVAERSGNYAGQDEPEFIEENGKLIACKVKVYRFSKTNERYQASVGVAYWNEYCPQQGQDFMWQKMPHTMLSKVAEALALRKAFPQDLSGLYTGEEMEQAVIEPVANGNHEAVTVDAHVEETASHSTVPMMNPDQVGRIKQMVAALNLTSIQMTNIRKRIGAPLSGDLTYDQAESYLAECEVMKKEIDEIPVINVDEPTPQDM